MPRSSPNVLLWSEEHQQYELHLRSQLHQRYHPSESEAFSRWLGEQTSFSFVGQAGWLSVIKEARAAGDGYWYAYRSQNHHTRKCYLGPTSRVTFVRLEEASSRLAHTPEVHEQDRTASQQPQTFLSIKFFPPRLPHVLVERPRLLRDLDAVCTSPLTLVSASAGSGKTTLLVTWIADSLQRLSRSGQSARAEGGERELAVAWLSLDAMDNDPIRFWGLCVAALQTCLPNIGRGAFALLYAPEAPPLSTILTMLLNELREERKLLVLILDDYHVIEHQAIAESMLFFLAHLPGNLHLVFVTRADPELPLARWRMRGQLIEIRDRDLRFSWEEATSFLRQATRYPLSKEEIAILQNHTEGWIAGLQLAALFLSGSEDVSAWVSDFRGSHRFVLDYVQQDILARLPVALQDFLLQTSILTRMNAAVCQAVLADSDLTSNQRMLEEVERANLFLVPLDEHRHWYRYHDLFREALLARLYTSLPQLVPHLHVRAARFYEAQGEWAEAIVHWFEAKDFSAAARLMEQTVEQFWVRGEVATMLRWVLALPEPLVREYAHLLLNISFYLLHTVAQTTQERRTEVYQEVLRLIGRVETTLVPSGHQLSVTRPDSAFSPEQTGNRDIEEAVLLRRIRLLRMGMVWFEAMAIWDEEHLNTLHQEMQELEQDEEVIWQLLPLFSGFVLHYTIRQEGAVLVPRLLEAQQRMSQSGSFFATTRVMQWLATAAPDAGRLRLTYEVCLTALDRIAQIKGYALLKGYFELALADVGYQWNWLEEARGRARMVIEDAQAWQHSDLLLSGYVALMQIELARGDLSAVQQTLHKFEQLKGYSDYWHWVQIIRAQCWLAQGQVNKASGWATEVVFPQDVWSRPAYNTFPIVIRVYFAQHRWGKALRLLNRYSGHLDRPANIRITITYLAQLLVVLHQTNQSEQVNEVASRLFALTEPEGYMRVYLDEGEPMRQTLLAWLTSCSSQQPQASSTMSYVSRLLVAFEQEANSAKRSPTAPDLTSSRVPQPSPASPLVAPLTRREQEVLRLLVAGQTYAEMAESLVVSPNTIKSQVGSVYRKLNVRNRVEAYAVTQHLHLL